MFTAINVKKLLANIALPFAVGLLARVLTRNYMIVYDTLVKPYFTPPVSVFPVIWSVIFLLLGISYYAIDSHKMNCDAKHKVRMYYHVQLIFNFVWVILFCNFHLRGFAAIWMLILLLIIWLTTREFSKISKLAGMMLWPYMAWSVFMLYLNYGFWILNK